MAGGQSYGRRVVAVQGRTVHASATDDAEHKVGAVTIDWETVDAAVGTPTVYPDDTVVPVGAKGLRFGTCLAKITGSGLYGPADSGANDGREIWTVPGTFYILDTTILEVPPLGLGGGVVPSDFPPVLNGGTVRLARLNIGGSGQPTLADVMAALPRIKILED